MSLLDWINFDNVADFLNFVGLLLSYSRGCSTVPRGPKGEKRSANVIGSAARIAHVIYPRSLRKFADPNFDPRIRDDEPHVTGLTRDGES